MNKNVVSIDIYNNCVVLLLESCYNASLGYSHVYKIKRYEMKLIRIKRELYPKKKE
jgi:hypothetical protein